MPANIDPTTGFAYGVTAARNIPFIYDMILSNGVNLSAEAADKEVCRLVSDTIGDLDDMLAGLTSDERLAHCTAAAALVSKNVDGGTTLAEQILELFDMDSGTIDIAEAQERALDYYREHRDCDGEDTYEYQDGTMCYLLDYLGGAPLIWVTRSEYITWAAPCSPCVPNAGDLDSPRPFEAGRACLSPSPDTYADEDAYIGGNIPFRIRRIDAQGNVAEPMDEWRLRPEQTDKDPAHE